ncbi:hypothetical protein BBM03_08655 [Vibrio parahaemolyticus]|nr:hypothetical protein BBM03_08655 [Vibrio parahaemolyticus]
MFVKGSKPARAFVLSLIQQPDDEHQATAKGTRTGKGQKVRNFPRVCTQLMASFPLNKHNIRLVYLLIACQCVEYQLVDEVMAYVMLGVLALMILCKKSECLYT